MKWSPCRKISNISKIGFKFKNWTRASLSHSTERNHCEVVVPYICSSIILRVLKYFKSADERRSTRQCLFTQMSTGIWGQIPKLIYIGNVYPIIIVIIYASVVDFVIEIKQENKEDNKQYPAASTLRYFLLNRECRKAARSISPFRVLYSLAKFRFGVIAH